MRLSVLGLTMLFLAGCGSSSNPPADGGTGGDIRAGRSADAWCSAVPALTTDRRTDLTGKANTYPRVRRVQSRYGERIMRCPGVTGHGIGKVRASKVVDDPDVPPELAKRVSDAEKDHLIAIYLLSGRYRPERPVYLDGVRVRFVVTGPIRALARGL